MARPKNPPAQSPAPQGRVYASQAEFLHDLFKLKPALMRKNMGYNPKKPVWESIEHAHLYHTVDSSGKPLTKCTPVGGHFHDVEMHENPDGGAPILKVGPPMRYIGTVEDGRIVKTVAPVKGDNHTHEAVYLHSEKIKPRRMSEEYLKFRAKQDSKAPKSTGDFAESTLNPEAAE